MNVPKLRFKDDDGREFPEWETKKLGEISSFFSGGTPLTTRKDFYIGEIPFIKSGEISSTKTAQCISEIGLKESSAKMVLRGDLLYALYGATSGEVAISQIKGAINQAVLCIRSKLNTYFLFSCFLYRKENIRQTYLQGGQGNLSAEIIKSLIVPIPSELEQTKIANFLTAIDEKISQLTQKCDLLAQYKKGVMQQIFSQQIRFKDDDGREFPEWEVIDLGNISFKVNLKNRNLQLSNVLTNSATQGIISQNDYFDRDIANKNNLGGYYIVEKDDFVYNPRISNNAPVGPIKRNRLIRGIMSPLYTVFRIKDSNLAFIEQFFETTYWHDYMKSISNFGARHDRMNITNESFFALPILLPSFPEQTKIANFLTAIDDKITHTQAQLAAMKQYKQGLLQQMFV